jgi:hypothetical protein
MIRVLQHDTDADARIVAILMQKLGIESIGITNDEELAAAQAMRGRAVVIGCRPDGSVQLMVVAREALPGPDEVFQ